MVIITASTATEQTESDQSDCLGTF